MLLRCPASSKIEKHGVESLTDGVYSVTTTTRYNAAAQPLTSVYKHLISQLLPSIETKSVFVSERGLTSTQWSEYSEHTKRVQYSTASTSSITAEAVMVDDFALSQKDTAGVITSFTRSYTVNDSEIDFQPEYDSESSNRITP